MNTFEFFLYEINFFFLQDSISLFGVLIHKKNIFGSAFLYAPKKALSSDNLITNYQEFEKNAEFPNNVSILFGFGINDQIQKYKVATYETCVIGGLIILTVSNFTLIRRFSYHIAES